MSQPVSIYRAMKPRQIGILIGVRLRDVELLCVGAIERPAPDRALKFSAPFVGVAPELPGLGDVAIGAESGGALSHVPNLDVESTHVPPQKHGRFADADR